MKTLTVQPAYGRQYYSAIEAISAWKDGKDFKIVQGPYVGIGEKQMLIADGYTHVTIRYMGSSVTFQI